MQEVVGRRCTVTAEGVIAGITVGDRTHIATLTFHKSIHKHPIAATSDQVAGTRPANSVECYESPLDARGLSSRPFMVFSSQTFGNFLVELLKEMVPQVVPTSTETSRYSYNEQKRGASGTKFGLFHHLAGLARRDRSALAGAGSMSCFEKLAFTHRQGMAQQRKNVFHHRGSKYCWLKTRPTAVGKAPRETQIFSSRDGLV
jgi:hypothetical protein